MLLLCSEWLHQPALALCLLLDLMTAGLPHRSPEQLGKALELCRVQGPGRITESGVPPGSCPAFKLSWLATSEQPFIGPDVHCPTHIEDNMDGPVASVDDVLPKDAPAPNTGASKPTAKKSSKAPQDGASAAPETTSRSKRDRQQVAFYTDDVKQSETFTVQQVRLQHTDVTISSDTTYTRSCSQSSSAGQGISAV